MQVWAGTLIVGRSRTPIAAVFMCLDIVATLRPSVESKHPVVVAHTFCVKPKPFGLKKHWDTCNEDRTPK